MRDRHKGGKLPPCDIAAAAQREGFEAGQSRSRPLTLVF